MVIRQKEIIFCQDDFCFRDLMVNLESIRGEKRVEGKCGFV